MFLSLHVNMVMDPLKKDLNGSNKGIGKELAIGLGSQGANIILLGRNSTGLDEVYDDLQKSRNTSPMIIEWT